MLFLVRHVKRTLVRASAAAGAAAGAAGAGAMMQPGDNVRLLLRLFALQAHRDIAALACGRLFQSLVPKATSAAAPASARPQLADAAVATASAVGHTLATCALPAHSEFVAWQWADPALHCALAAIGTWSFGFPVDTDTRVMLRDWRMLPALSQEAARDMLQGVLGPDGGTRAAGAGGGAGAGAGSASSSSASAPRAMLSVDKRLMPHLLAVGNRVFDVATLVSRELCAAAPGFHDLAFCQQVCRPVPHFHVQCCACGL